MAGINIPGVTDKYNTNDTIEKLMKVERVPLVREQQQLETYKSQKDAWRNINTHLTALRDSIKSLYSYENPFNNKLTTSTDENAITAEANRGADIQDFKIDVIQPATADRFLTKELEKDFKVPGGLYVYKVGEKKISISWKGGSLKDFSDAINKRSNGVVKSMLIGSSSGKKTLLIESLTTGKENKLVFEEAAKDFALSSSMITPVKSKSIDFGTELNELKASPAFNEENFQERMPALSLSKVTSNKEGFTIDPRGSFEIKIPEKVLSNSQNHITFSVSATNQQDITEKLNQTADNPDIKNSGFAEFEGIIVHNELSDSQIPYRAPVTSLEPVVSEKLIYAVMKDGSEKLLDSSTLFSSEKSDFDIALSEYPDIDSIVFRNLNTGASVNVSSFKTYNPTESLGFEPVNPITVADDAIIKYEGIKLTRSSNDIDDVIPEVTLHVHEKTDKTATLSVKPDSEASKDALIKFVGEYNQTMAKINILSQNKEEVINELTYLSDEEKEKERENLGMFQSDFSLSNIKNNMQSIIATGYKFSDDAEITMLSQIGIATNASGYSGGYSESKLRGYLEIDEKKLDSALENHLDDIKNIFGYDSDGDLIIDTGIAYNLDKQISAYTQTGGILALKTSNIDSKIKSSETKIAKLEDQMKDKEADLRYKYGQMEGSLNSLESQQSSLENFSKRNNNN